MTEETLGYKRGNGGTGLEPVSSFFIFNSPVIVGGVERWLSPVTSLDVVSLCSIIVRINDVIDVQESTSTLQFMNQFCMWRGKMGGPQRVQKGKLGIIAALYLGSQVEGAKPCTLEWCAGRPGMDTDPD